MSLPKLNSSGWRNSFINKLVHNYEYTLYDQEVYLLLKEVILAQKPLP